MDVSDDMESNETSTAQRTSYSTLKQWPQLDYDENVIIQASVDASRCYFDKNTKPEDFLPISERLTMPILHKFFKLGQTTQIARKRAIDTTLAMIKAQIILAQDADHSWLVKVTMANRAVHRESYRMALEGIYREGSCAAFLKRVEDVTLRVATRTQDKHPRQTVGDLDPLYDHANRVRHRYQRLVETLAQRSGGVYHKASLKVRLSDIDSCLNLTVLP